MKYDDLPEYYMPYFDNFTGPGWSDGKFQSSTSRGKKPALTKLDTHSKEHDGSYAVCSSLSCLDDADEMYAKRTAGMSFVPRTIGKMPKYGNAPLRKVYKMLGWGYVGREAGENMVYVNKEREAVLAEANRRGRLRGSLPPINTPTPLTEVPGVCSAPYYGAESLGTVMEEEISGTPYIGNVGRFPRILMPLNPFRSERRTRNERLEPLNPFRSRNKWRKRK